VRTTSTLIPLAVLAATLTGAIIQPASPETPRQAVPPELIPDDLARVQMQIDTLYALISGPQGERDWERFNALFLDHAILTQAYHRPDKSTVLMTLTPKEFATQSGQYLNENPFYESELTSRIDLYANLAHVWSTYESRTDPTAEPFSRGINSIQLLKNSDGAWKILAITWDSESSGIPIPAQYK